MEASVSVGQDVIRWRQSNTLGETLRERVVVCQLARANTGLLAGDDSILDPTITVNHMVMKREAKQKKLHQMAKVHDLLEMWQSSQNLRATQTSAKNISIRAEWLRQSGRAP